MKIWHFAVVPRTRLRRLIAIAASTFATLVASEPTAAAPISFEIQDISVANRRVYGLGSNGDPTYTYVSVNSTLSEHIEGDVATANQSGPNTLHDLAYKLTYASSSFSGPLTGTGTAATSELAALVPFPLASAFLSPHITAYSYFYDYVVNPDSGLRGFDLYFNFNSGGTDIDLGNGVYSMSGFSYSRHYALREPLLNVGDVGIFNENSLQSMLSSLSADHRVAYQEFGLRYEGTYTYDSIGQRKYSYTTYRGFDQFGSGRLVYEVPEPSSLALFILGIFGCVAARRRTHDPLGFPGPIRERVFGIG